MRANIVICGTAYLAWLIFVALYRVLEGATIALVVDWCCSILAPNVELNKACKSNVPNCCRLISI